MRSRKKVVEGLELRAMYAHEGIYYLRDMKYIIRIIRKIAKQLPKKRGDIDWLQNYIESFLILNSRFYEDLVTDLVKEVKKHHILPESFSVKWILKEYQSCLSMKYHAEKKHNRNRAAHGSNYQRIGIPEFNDILPRPFNFKSTPPRFNSTSGGQEVVEAFIKKLQPSTKAKLARLLDLVCLTQNQWGRACTNCGCVESRKFGYSTFLLRAQPSFCFMHSRKRLRKHRKKSLILHLAVSTR